MLKIRLQRRGKRNYATYRVVVTEQGAPVQGRFIADVGHYNPHTDEFSVEKEAVQQWLAKGAQASPTVHNLLITHSIIKGEKVTSWRPKRKEEQPAAKEQNQPVSEEQSQPTGELAAETSKDEKPQETPSA